MKYDDHQTHANRVAEINTTGAEISLAKQTFRKALDLDSDILANHPELRCPGRIALTFCTTEYWERNKEDFSAELHKTASKPLANGLNIEIKPSAGLDDDPYIVIREAASRRYQAIVIGDGIINELSEQKRGLEKVRIAIFLHEHGLSEISIFKQIMSDFRIGDGTRSYQEAADQITKANFEQHRGREMDKIDFGSTMTLDEQIVFGLASALPKGRQGCRAILQILKDQPDFGKYFLSDDNMIDFVNGAERTLRTLAHERPH